MADRPLSLWHDTLPDGDDLTPRAPLPGDRDTDVAIVGAGFTGLWTALYLRRLDPSLRVTLVEAEVAGFGASGRNGGWCSALLPMGLVVDGRLGRARRRHRHAAGHVRDRRRGGSGRGRGGHRLPLRQGRLPPPGHQPGPHRTAAGGAGGGPPVRPRRGRPALAGPGGGGRSASARPASSARCYTPHCAAIHPARLARGLATAVERHGAVLHEAHPGDRHRTRAACAPTGARSRPTSSSGPPRATRPRSTASAGRWCRSTRS